MSKKRVFMLRCSIFIILWASLQPQLRAQYNMPQNDVWIFAGGEGVNFSGGSGPVSITTSSATQEGSASVSDNSGNLLFYTGGIDGYAGAKVYDRTGTEMPHGSAIVTFTTYSTTQAAAIVPVIGNPNQYYVFSLEQGGSGEWGASPAGFCRLYYCIVDMTLNSGLGDVIASTIATPLDSGLSEKMTVVAGDNCNIWLLAHAKDEPAFKAYSISSTGISAAVVSSATGEIPTGTNAYKIGTIKVSPNRTMISNCVVNGAYLGGGDRLELLQFNPTTGIISGCQVLNNFINQYDADFSPDNSKLYARVMGSKVYQYDLSLLPDIGAVISSEFLVYTSPNWGGQMKLGPNGKMYLQTGSAYLDCINSPNLSGSLCDYTYHAIHLAGFSSISNIGMPNMQIIANPTDTVKTHTDTTLCGLEGAIILNASHPSAWYAWSTGATTPSVSVIDNGTYWVKSVNGCNLQLDTFNVNVTPATLVPTVTSANFCSLASVTLTAPPTYSSHVWNTGATTSSVTATTGGEYWVADSNLTTCSLQTDTFHVTAIPRTLMPTETNAMFCIGKSVSLAAPPYYVAYVWNTGATAPSVTVTTIGTYWVTDTNLTTCTMMTDTFHVTSPAFTLIPTETPASFCTGASVALIAPASYTTYVWNTGETTSSVIVATADVYWVTDTNLTTCTIYSDTFNVLEGKTPLITLGNDTTICLGHFTTLSSPVSVGSFLWSTGSTASSIAVQPGHTYYLTVTNQGCSIADTIKVNMLSAPAPVILGADTTLCKGEILILTGGADTLLWSTGVTATSIVVTDPGIYSTTTTNVCGSSYSSINVNFETCYMDFPNAFTPNNDGRNDIARAIGYLSPFKKYKLSIYNRYGQRIFYTEDIYAGWDGTFNNVPQDLDTYFYMITYTLNGNDGLLKGDLTLIR